MIRDLKASARSACGSVLLATALAASGCATPKKHIEKRAEEHVVTVAAVPVSRSCQKAVARQAGRSGFALVVQAADVMAPEIVSKLDNLYRRVHAIRGVQSVQSLTDEQVVMRSDLGVSVEPFVPPEGLDREGRLARVGHFAGLVDPALLSPDLRVTALIVKLLPTSHEDARAEIRSQLLELARSAPAPLRISLTEYPVAARESLTWKTNTSLAALKIVDDNLRGGGVIELGATCGQDDCLLDPARLQTIDSLEKSIRSLQRVRASWSFVHVLRYANRAMGNKGLPQSADAALQLLAIMDTSSGVSMHCDRDFKRAAIRVHFSTGNAADYCTLGKSLKKMASEASSPGLRIYVKRPGREGF